MPRFWFGALSAMGLKVNQGSVLAAGASSTDSSPVIAAGMKRPNVPSAFIAATLLIRVPSRKARAVYAVFGAFNASSSVP